MEKGLLMKWLRRMMEGKKGYKLYFSKFSCVAYPKVILHHLSSCYTRDTQKAQKYSLKSEHRTQTCTAAKNTWLSCFVWSLLIVFETMSWPPWFILISSPGRKQTSPSMPPLFPRRPCFQSKQGPVQVTLSWPDLPQELPLGGCQTLRSAWGPINLRHVINNPLCECHFCLLLAIHRKTALWVVEFFK